MRKHSFNLRRLRLSLKYRPDIMKLILKMRQCIRKKNTMLIKLKHRLKEMDCIHKLSVHSETEDAKFKEEYNNVEKTSNKSTAIDSIILNLTKNKSSQTDNTDIPTNNMEELQSKPNDIEKPVEDVAWSTKEDKGHKSIAEQVKEAAQDAMKESGMVYVESAGMYYDYKTGYYYNSELGLYYHTDTGCYYSYSNEKQSFVFHSYPDRSAAVANASLIAHEKKKAKKHKMEKKTKEDIDNLTKNLSQDQEKDGKEKPKKSKRKKIEKNEPSQTENKDQDKQKPEDSSDLTSEDKEVVGDNNVEKISDAECQELEDGECSETDSESSDDEEDKKSDISTSTASDDASVAKHHPPCMRIIVRETSLPKLKVGSLFIVTKDGGTVGREGDQHTIVLRDHNVSRNHLHIRYDSARKAYMATDLGSKNGSVLNGSRMSASQLTSEPMEIVHGSTLQLGETKLLCHIHSGNDTCGHCEPGLLMETIEKEKTVAYTRTCSVQKQHQLELARLKNKYAPKQLCIEETAYNDRAHARREAVGSSHHSEKTQTSDVHTYIPPENKGFKLLEKMGWSKGEGLGRDSQGDTEPVPLVSNEGTSGLGAAPAPPSAPNVSKTLGPATMRLASKTKMLKPPAKAFQQPLEEDSD